MQKRFLEPLVRSFFFQAVEKNGQVFIWHSLFGHPKIISSETFRFLDEFRQPKSLSQVATEYGTGVEDLTALEDLINGYFLVPSSLDERELLVQRVVARNEAVTSGALIVYLELIMSEACNLRCQYCIHFNNLETSDRLNSPKKFMTFQTARETVDAYLRILRVHGKRVAEVNFGGGEPLLAWPVIKQFLEYCTLVYGGEFEFSFSINTNATLMTPEIARTLKEYRVSPAVSLDGLQKGNDKVRVTRTGKGTFLPIVNGMETLVQADYPLDGFAVTITEWNFGDLDERFIDWAVERGMNEVRIDIDVIDIVDVPVTDIIGKLMRIRRYAKSRGVEIPGFWSRAFENLNGSALEEHVAFCGAVRGNSICVSPSGKIYGCGYSTTQLGTLAEIAEFYKAGGAYHRFVQHRVTGAMEMCKGCMIEGQCGGGCNITQEFARATRIDKIERMCEFYRGMMQELVHEQLLES